jgi:hypothetical protein
MMHWVGFTSIVPLPTTVFDNPEVNETAKLMSAQAAHAKPSSSQLFRANATAFANPLEYNLAPPAIPARSFNRTKLPREVSSKALVREEKSQTGSISKQQTRATSLKTRVL